MTDEGGQWVTVAQAALDLLPSAKFPPPLLGAVAIANDYLHSRVDTHNWTRFHLVLASFMCVLVLGWWIPSPGSLFSPPFRQQHLSL